MPSTFTVVTLQSEPTHWVDDLHVRLDDAGWLAIDAPLGPDHASLLNRLLALGDESARSAAGDAEAVLSLRDPGSGCTGLLLARSARSQIILRAVSEGVVRSATEGLLAVLGADAVEGLEQWTESGHRSAVGHVRQPRMRVFGSALRWRDVRRA